MVLTPRQKLVSYIVLIATAVIFLFPYLWMIGTSLKTNLDTLRRAQDIFTFPLQWQNYPTAFEYINYPRLFLNSVVMAVGVTLGQLALAAPAGYALARIPFRGRNLLLLVLLAVLIIPFEAIFIPIYIIVNKLGWLNTFLALIVPSIGNPFAIYIFRQFFLTLPPELEEAARVDGANRFQVFYRIMLPLAQPAIVTVTVLTFLAEWGTLLKPIVFTTSNQMATLQVGIASLNRGAGESEPRLAWLMAATTMVIFVPMILFMIGQRYFVESVAQSGLK